jgi:regulatory protein
MKPPTSAALQEAALTHLSRYASTEASLARVLRRRLDRWARAQEGEPEEIAAAAAAAAREIPGIIARLRALGAVNDAAFAASRAKRLTRSGKSRRATQAHLAAKGVRDFDLPADPERELAAACAYLRRRRAGPFGDADESKVLAAMARGGFSQDTSRQALRLDFDAAETLILKLQQNSLTMVQDD